MKRIGSAAASLPLTSLAGCAPQASSGVAPAIGTPGFLLGLWHGFILLVAWVLSLFVPHIVVYGRRPTFILSACPAGSRRAVPNTGGWDDFGYFIGIVFLGVGARSGTRTVCVRTRRPR